MAEEAGSGPDPIDEAWERVDRAWDDEETHRKFIALCRALGRLPEAGRRYREIRDRDPSRRDAAAAHIDALLSAAMLEMQAHRSPPPMRHGKRWLTIVALLLMLGFMGVVAYAISVSN
jgi:hypothetical protein